MIRRNIELIEGMKHELRFVLTGVDDVVDFEPFGYISPLGCKHQSWKIEKVGESYFLPALQNGIYNYQIFIRQLSTNKDFLALEGKVEVKNSLMEENNSSLGGTEIEISFDANTTEIHCEISKGLKGDNGLSTYEIAKKHGFTGTEEEWLNSLKQEAASIAISEVGPMAEYVSYAEKEIKNKQELISIAQNEVEQIKDIVLEHCANAENAADEAKKSEQNTLTHEEKVIELSYEIENLRNDCKKNAENAAISEQVSVASVERASQSAEIAAEKAGISIASASEAVTGATNAAASATAAASSATQAAKSAALVGDAVMTLPWDYMRFSHVTSIPELAAQATDLLDTEVWRYPLNSLGNDIGGYFNTYFPKLKKVMIWCDGEYFSLNSPGSYFAPYYKLEEVRLVFPNATNLRYGCYQRWHKVDRLYVYAPKVKEMSGYFVSGYDARYVWCFSPIKGNYNWAFGSEVRTIGYIGNAVEELWVPEMSQLTSVLCTFPLAKKINFQKAKLDKESVLRVVGGLLTYDSSTMTAVPELTLGINPALDGDVEINEALLLAQTAVEDGGKGWNVAVSGFTITAGNVATEGLTPHVYAKRWQDENGLFVGTDGARWSIRYGNTVLENGIANEQLGYEEFATIEDALEIWGLSEYKQEQ